MFFPLDNKLGYGLGGRVGLKQLPEHLVDKVRIISQTMLCNFHLFQVRHILDKKRTSERDLDADLEIPRKMGKKPVAYGNNCLNVENIEGDDHDHPLQLPPYYC